MLLTESGGRCCCFRCQTWGTLCLCLHPGKDGRERSANSHQDGKGVIRLFSGHTWLGQITSFSHTCTPIRDSRGSKQPVPVILLCCRLLAKLNTTPKAEAISIYTRLVFSEVQIWSRKPSIDSWHNTEGRSGLYNQNLPRPTIPRFPLYPHAVPATPVSPGARAVGTRQEITFLHCCFIRATVTKARNWPSVPVHFCLPDIGYSHLGRGASTEKMPPSDWLVSMCTKRFLD